MAGRVSSRPKQVGDDQGVEFIWADLQGPTGGTFTLTIWVHMRADGPLVRFSGSVDYNEATSGTLGVGRFDFPILDIEDRGTESELYVSGGGGLRFRDPAHSARTGDGSPFDLLYPSGQNMRFNAYADTETVSLIFISVDDEGSERFALKHFLAEAAQAHGTDEPVVRMSVGRLPPDPFHPHDVTIAGDTIVGAGHGVYLPFVLRGSSAASFEWTMQICFSPASQPVEEARYAFPPLCVVGWSPPNSAGDVGTCSSRPSLLPDRRKGQGDEGGETLPRTTPTSSQSANMKWGDYLWL